MPGSPQLLLSILLLCVVGPLSVHAETKVLTAEATYTMGDGETPSFAEAMALQKAKQMALEQAGTYVESYTKVQNYQLTADEIQTIAGGVLQVEVLGRKRELIGDGMRHFVKIKATVTTDRVAELAQRIKGKNVAEEYKKLQEDYAKLSNEIETWKQLVAKAPVGPEREKALDQIRDREKAFAGIQKNEAAFFQRLVSGEALFSKALGQLSKKQNDKLIADALFQKILEEGFRVKIGEPNIHTALTGPEVVKISVPITLSTTETIISAVQETARSLGGYFDRSGNGLSVYLARDQEISIHFARRFPTDLRLAIEFVLRSGEIRSCALGTGLLFNRGTTSRQVFIADKPQTIVVVMPMLLEEAQKIETIKARSVVGPEQMSACREHGD